MGKIENATNYTLKELINGKTVSLDYLSKKVSFKFGSLNLYECISRLRHRLNLIVGISQNKKEYLILQFLEGKFTFPDGYTRKVADTNNKMSSAEAWKVFKHEDGNYYFDNQSEIKDIPFQLITKETQKLMKKVYDI